VSAGLVHAQEKHRLLAVGVMKVKRPGHIWFLHDVEEFSQLKRNATANDGLRP